MALERLRSREYLAAWLAERGPAVATFVLAVLLAVQAGILVTRFFGADDARPVESGSVNSPALLPRNRAVDVLAIAQAHLFGTAPRPQADPATAPQTQMQMILAGVIASNDPATGFAILGDSAAAAKFYAVGDTLPGGVRLHSVYPDRVLLDRGGSLESLSLPRQPLRTAAVTPLSLPTGDAQTSAVMDRMRQALAANPSIVGDVIRYSAVMQNGKLVGVRVNPGTNPQAFSRLGLRSGDLVTAINGTPLDDPARGEEIFRTLGSMPQARVSIKRNGRETDLVLDMTQVTQEAEQLMNTPGLTPIDQLPPSQAPAPQ